MWWQKIKESWKEILGTVILIGVLLFAVYMTIKMHDATTFYLAVINAMY